MRNLRWLTILVVTLATITTVFRELPTVAAGPPDDTAALQKQVRRLLNDLAGDTRAQRIEAERRLLALGPPILPHLPAPELLPSNSVREVVRRIRLELERTAAADSVRLSRVRLDGTESVRDAVACITLQTGNLVEARFLPADLLRKEVGLK